MKSTDSGAPTTEKVDESVKKSKESIHSNTQSKESLKNEAPNESSVTEQTKDENTENEADPNSKDKNMSGLQKSSSVTNANASSENNNEATTDANGNTEENKEENSTESKNDLNVAKNTQEKDSSQALNPSPLSQNPVTTGQQQPNTLTKEEKINIRRIIAEDSKWNLAPVKTLSQLCVDVIVENFEKRPILSPLSKKYKEIILNKISVDMPLEITTHLINEDFYWKRCAISKFKNCDVKKHHDSWKFLYFELLTQKLIEDYIPKVDKSSTEDIESDAEDNDVLVNQLFNKNDKNSEFVNRSMEYELEKKIEQDKMEEKILSGTEQEKQFFDKLELVSDFVRELNIEQLHPTEGLELKKTDPLPDHVNIKAILDRLKKVEKLSIYYGVKDCGLDFEWKYYGMTINDCVNLHDSLKNNNILSSLTISSSQIDDNRIRLLCKVLLDNTTLQYFDISHNNIADVGARAIAKLLTKETVNIKYLSLLNNQINEEGAHCIGRAICANKKLETLIIGLNPLMDAGGYSILRGIYNNDTLKYIDMSACQLKNETVPVLSKLIKKNSPILKTIIISSNNLGIQKEKRNIFTKDISMEQDAEAKTPVRQQSQEGEGLNIDIFGKAIFEATSMNKNLIKFDLRFTDISLDYIVAIDEIIKENYSLLSDEEKKLYQI